MSRDPTLRLEDIRTACAKIRRWTAGLDFARFVADDRTFDAVLRNLEVVGQAVKHLPDHLLRQYPEVPWRNIAAMRDVVIHGYFGVDAEIVWDVVCNHIPKLLETVERMLASGDFRN